jgi:legumain
LNVLRGDSAGNKGGKVLKSNENSKVFIYFADHGAVGMIAMPDGGVVWADKLHDTL